MSHYPPTPAFGVFTWPAPKPAPSSDTAVDTNRAQPMNSADTASAHTCAPMLLKNVADGKGVGHIAEESDSTEEGEVLENLNGQHGPSRTGPKTQDTGFSEGSDDPSLSFRYTSQRSSRSLPSSPPENRKRLNKRLRTDKKNRSRNGNSRERGARVPPAGPSSMNPPFGDRGLDHINNLRSGRGRGGTFSNPPRGPRATLPSRQNPHPRISNGQGFYGHSDETQTSSQASIYSDALLAVKDLHNWNVTFHDIAAETGCSITALRKMYKELKITIPLQLPPPPLGYTNQQQPVQTLQVTTSTVTKNPDEEARKIREKLERSLAETRRKNEAEARERERKEREMREVEAAAREKERKEKEKVEEEKRKQLEVEAKRDILRKKLETMNLTGKLSPMQGAVTPVSSTPVQFATLHNPAPSIAPPVARIPGLLMSQQETTPDQISVVKVSQNGDIVTQNPPPTLVASPTPTETPSSTPPYPNNNSSIVPPATTIRRKRPVASDSFPDYALPKRRFGTQTSDPLIIEASEDEDDNTFKSPHLSRAKTLPPFSTPTATTQAEELEKKIKALKAEIAAKKRKTKNGMSAGPTPVATPPARDVPLQPDASTTPVTESDPALTKAQDLSTNGTNESTTNSIQGEENGSEQAEQTRQELQAALSKAEDQQRTLLEEQTQRNQPEITYLSSSMINKEENRLKRLREIEEKVEARKRAMEEMRREMEELEASRRALSEEYRPFSPPADLKQAEKGDLKCVMAPTNMVAHIEKDSPAAAPQTPISHELSSTSLLPSATNSESKQQSSAHSMPAPQARGKPNEIVSGDECVKTSEKFMEAVVQDHEPPAATIDNMDIDEPLGTGPTAEVSTNDAPVIQNDIEMESEEQDSDTGGSSDDSSSSDDSDLSDSDEEESPSEASMSEPSVTEPLPEISVPVPAPATQPDPLSVSDKSEAPVVISSYDPEELNHMLLREPLRKKFTPYVSPLPIVRSFRTKPVFLEEHLSEMQGLKYSTKIDPYKELCRFELNGGICNDTSCKSQHFRNMAVGDDELLVDLADIENVPEYYRDTYRDGLYEVIQDMRKNGIRDFTTVAKGILKFRRRWAEKQNNEDTTMTDV